MSKQILFESKCFSFVIHKDLILYLHKKIAESNTICTLLLVVGTEGQTTGKIQDVLIRVNTVFES